MKLEMRQDFIELFSEIKKGLKVNVYYTLIILFAFTILIYSTGKKFDTSFYVSELLLLVSGSCILYARINYKAKIINNTVASIEISQEGMCVTTLPFKFYFFTNKKEKMFDITFQELKIGETSYPIKQVYDLDDNVFQYFNGNDNIFIISDFFDIQLKKRLLEFAKKY